MHKFKKKKIKKFFADLVDQRIVRQIIFLLILAQFILIIALIMGAREERARGQRLEEQISVTLNEQRDMNEKLKGVQSSQMMLQSQFYRVLNTKQVEEEN